MAKKAKNILDFRDKSQRLFIMTWVLMIFVILIMFLSSSSSSKLPFLAFTPFLAFGLVSIVGSLACKKLLEVLDDKKKAIKKSNRIHRCQVAIIIMLFVFLAGLGTVLTAYICGYFLQDKFGDNQAYSIVNEDAQINTTVQPSAIVKQQLMGNIINTSLIIVVCLIYLVRYMKIVITSDVARKDFSNLPKKTVKIAKKTEPAQEPKLEISDDSDDCDL